MGVFLAIVVFVQDKTDRPPMNGLLQPMPPIRAMNIVWCVTVGYSLYFLIEFLLAFPSWGRCSFDLDLNRSRNHDFDRRDINGGRGGGKRLANLVSRFGNKKKKRKGRSLSFSFSPIQPNLYQIHTLLLHPLNISTLYHIISKQ